MRRWPLVTTPIGSPPLAEFAVDEMQASTSLSAAKGAEHRSTTTDLWRNLRGVLANSYQVI